MLMEEGGYIDTKTYMHTSKFSLMDFLQEMRVKDIKAIFMQDNAWVPTAHSTVPWMVVNVVELLKD